MPRHEKKAIPIKKIDFKQVNFLCGFDEFEGVTAFNKEHHLHIDNRHKARNWNGHEVIQTHLKCAQNRSAGCPVHVLLYDSLPAESIMSFKKGYPSRILRQMGLESAKKKLAKGVQFGAAEKVALVEFAKQESVSEFDVGENDLKEWQEQEMELLETAKREPLPFSYFLCRDPCQHSPVCHYSDDILPPFPNSLGCNAADQPSLVSVKKKKKRLIDSPPSEKVIFRKESIHSERKRPKLMNRRAGFRKPGRTPAAVISRDDCENRKKRVSQLPAAVERDLARCVSSLESHSLPVPRVFLRSFGRRLCAKLDPQSYLSKKWYHFFITRNNLTLRHASDEQFDQSLVSRALGDPCGTDGGC